MLKKLCAAGALLAASAGFVLLGGTAHAEPVIEIPATVDVKAPIVVCGNNVQVVGESGVGECYGGASTGL